MSYSTDYIGSTLSSPSGLVSRMQETAFMLGQRFDDLTEADQKKAEAAVERIQAAQAELYLLL